MKKIIAVATSVIILLLLFSGCNPNKQNISKLPDWLSGTDAAKLLLADQRLDSSVLRKEGDIFDDGTKVMQNLASTAKNNLRVVGLNYTGGSVTLSKTAGKEVISDASTRGKLERDDQNYYWSDFVENNNSYDYFLNITEGIVSTAESAGELIDHVKMYVRVVDKWIAIDEGVQYYLHVEENSELLIEHYTGEGLDNITICMRYKNDRGQDVYEVYIHSKPEDVSTRMKYIPGMRYEYTFQHKWSGDNGMNCLIADKSKGYWETSAISVLPKGGNVSYFIMKDDLCYDASYILTDQSIGAMKIMSADRATDIFYIRNNDTILNIALKFSGFNGIKSVQAPYAAVDFNSANRYANMKCPNQAILNFTNGKSAGYGDMFANGNVEVREINVVFCAGDIYTGEVALVIQGQTKAEQFENLKLFLNETGLTCRRNMDGVLRGINLAYTDARVVSELYKWNGVNLKNEAALLEAAAKERTICSQLYSLYTSVQNVESISINDVQTIELNIQFAPITASSFDAVKLDGRKLSIGTVSLTVDDTLLFVNDATYTIAFALLTEDQKLVHLSVEDITGQVYNDEDTFLVNASDIQFEIPTLSPGKYTLVAYIAAAEGIRSSAYASVIVGQIMNVPVSDGNIQITAHKLDQGNLQFVYESSKNFTLELTSQSKLNYDEFLNAVKKEVFAYGTAGDTLEKMTEDGSFVALNGNEQVIENGIYRIAYRSGSDDQTQGYVSVHYQASAQ